MSFLLYPEILIRRAALSPQHLLKVLETHDITTAIRLVQDFADQEEFKKGLLLSSPSLVDRLDSFVQTLPADFRKKEQQTLRSLLSYLGRMTIKVSPLGRFGYVGYAKSAAEFELWPNKQPHYSCQTNVQWTEAASKAWIQENEEAWLLETNRNILKEADNHYCWVHEQEGSTFVHQYHDEDGFLDAIFEFMKPGNLCEYVLLIQYLSEITETEDVEAVKAVVNQFIDIGLLHIIVPGISPYEEGLDMMASNFTNKCHDDRLQSFKSMLSDLSATDWAAPLLPHTPLFFENATFPTEAKYPLYAIEQKLPSLHAITQCALAYEAPAFEEKSNLLRSLLSSEAQPILKIFEKYVASGSPTPVFDWPSFGNLAVKSRDKSEIQLNSADLQAALGESPKAFPLYSALLQPTTHQKPWIINHLAAGNGRLIGRFATIEVADILLSRLENDVDEGVFYVSLKDEAKHNTLIHPPLCCLAISMSFEGFHQQVYPLSIAKVSANLNENGQPQLTVPQGWTLQPLEFEVLAPEHRSPLYNFLLLFSPPTPRLSPLRIALQQHFEQTENQWVRYTPRIVIDNQWVIARAQWQIDFKEAIPKTAAMMAAQLKEWGCPSRFFFHFEGQKPEFGALEHPLYEDYLWRRLRNTSGLLYICELYPDFDDIDAKGKYAHEALITWKKQ